MLRSSLDDISSISEFENDFSDLFELESSEVDISQGDLLSKHKNESFIEDISAVVDKPNTRNLLSLLRRIQQESLMESTQAFHQLCYAQYMIRKDKKIVEYNSNRFPEWCDLSKERNAQVHIDFIQCLTEPTRLLGREFKKRVDKNFEDIALYYIQNFYSRLKQSKDNLKNLSLGENFSFVPYFIKSGKNEALGIGIYAVCGGIGVAIGGALGAAAGAIVTATTLGTDLGITPVTLMGAMGGAGGAIGLKVAEKANADKRLEKASENIKKARQVKNKTKQIRNAYMLRTIMDFSSKIYGDNSEKSASKSVFILGKTGCIKMKELRECMFNGNFEFDLDDLDKQDFYDQVRKTTKSVLNNKNSDARAKKKKWRSNSKKMSINDINSFVSETLGSSDDDPLEKKWPYNDNKTNICSPYLRQIENLAKNRQSEEKEIASICKILDQWRKNRNWTETEEKVLLSCLSEHENSEIDSSFKIIKNDIASECNGFFSAIRNYLIEKGNNINLDELMDSVTNVIRESLNNPDNFYNDCENLLDTLIKIVSVQYSIDLLIFNQCFEDKVNVVRGAIANRENFCLIHCNNDGQYNRLKYNGSEPLNISLYSSNEIITINANSVNKVDKTKPISKKQLSSKFFTSQTSMREKVNFAWDLIKEANNAKFLDDNEEKINLCYQKAIEILHSIPEKERDKRINCGESKFSANKLLTRLEGLQKLQNCSSSGL